MSQVKIFEDKLIKTIVTYDVLQADKASITQVLSQLNESNTKCSRNLQVLKINKLGPQKALEKWKRENEIILKELSPQAESALKTQSYNSVTIREESVYENGNAMELICDLIIIINSDGQYHFTVGLFICEARLLE